MAPARALIAGALALGPAALAFFSGGYFAGPRLWAGLTAWVLVVAAALTAPRLLPRSPAAVCALAGLAAFTVWTAVSIHWAPLRDIAQGDSQRVALYLGALVAGTLALRERRLARAAELLIVLGALAVVGEGLSERILPGVFALERSPINPGRLFQPITYWNAEGLYAAVALVLSVRIAGDRTRSAVAAAAAAALVPVFALAVQLTVSRGAILSTFVGLVVLLLVSPTRAQARAIAIGVALAAPVVVAAALMPGLRLLTGDLATRERGGVIMLVVLLAAGGNAVLATGLARRRPDGAPATLRRLAGAAALVVALATVAVFVGTGLQRGSNAVNARATADASRLGNVESIRGAFWRVAVQTWTDHPLRGAGTGAFRVEWLQRRTVRYFARDAHSLYFQTLAELGLVGVTLLALFLAGVGACTRRLAARDPVLAAGPVALVVMWAVAAGLDWQWQMPAVGLLFILGAAIVVAGADHAARLPR